MAHSPSTEHSLPPQHATKSQHRTQPPRHGTQSSTRPSQPPDHATESQERTQSALSTGQSHSDIAEVRVNILNVGHALWIAIQNEIFFKDWPNWTLLIKCIYLCRRVQLCVSNAHSWELRKPPCYTTLQWCIHSASLPRYSPSPRHSLPPQHGTQSSTGPSDPPDHATQSQHSTVSLLAMPHSPITGQSASSPCHTVQHRTQPPRHGTQSQHRTQPPRHGTQSTTRPSQPPDHATQSQERTQSASSTGQSHSDIAEVRVNILNVEPALWIAIQNEQVFFKDWPKWKFLIKCIYLCRRVQLWVSNAHSWELMKPPRYTTLQLCIYSAS